MNNINFSIRKLEAGQTETFEARGDDQSLWLTCLQGKLWLTIEGDEKDYVLVAGQSLVFHGESRKMVVEALLDNASFRVRTAYDVKKESTRSAFSA